ncbi:hypothetical protein [Muricoccus nepalensis]|uniref:hypothetical protein n=1 Tax=Muricoccus nepalensis TaxID=1854500 RepID=UPI0013869C88|nr:hypothetical protein [Roseomonas nepalensis]
MATTKDPSVKELLLTHVSQQALIMKKLDDILAGKAKPLRPSPPAPTGAAPVIKL